MKKQEANSEEKFPGYPHYDAKDDITVNEKKADADVEALSDATKNIKPIPKDELIKEEEEKPVAGENDITDEDLKILGSKDQDMDGGDDETLIPSIKLNEDIMGGDLDVPGNDYNDPDMDPDNDEENNLFSRGQD